MKKGGLHQISSRITNNVKNRDPAHDRVTAHHGLCNQNDPERLRQESKLKISNWIMIRRVNEVDWV
jgi:uncharacterized protein YaeQ